MATLSQKTDLLPTLSILRTQATRVPKAQYELLERDPIDRKACSVSVAQRAGQFLMKRPRTPLCQSQLDPDKRKPRKR